jgi:hypothetical protein
MRVLFLRADDLSAPVRVIPLLESLCAAGHIRDVCSVDRELAATGDCRLPFDVVLAHRNPGSRQIAWLRRSGLPFAYDIDDLMLRRSAPAGRRHAREQDAIRWCLTNASYVTAPSRRLLATLDRYLGGTLSGRAVYLPNAALESAPARPAAAVPRLLWVSSHGQHYEELEEVAAGVAAAARALGTGVTLIGRFPVPVRALIPGHRHVPWVEPRQYRLALAAGAFVAAAPLPLALPPEEQEFVDCKSDIKAAQYGSLGIAALYSPASPYRETDLPCTVAPGNLAADWRSGMIALAKGFPQQGLALAQHPAVIARERTLIAQRLLEVLLRVRAATGKPFAFRASVTPPLFRRLERGVRSLRARLFR